MMWLHHVTHIHLVRTQIGSVSIEWLVIELPTTCDGTGDSASYRCRVDSGSPLFELNEGMQSSKGTLSKRPLRKAVRSLPKFSYLRSAFCF